MDNKKRNYWPHAIVLSIFGVLGLCIWTVKTAVDNPVEMDSFYFESYQKVDEDINRIRLSQIEFDKRFDVSFLIKSFNLNRENSIDIKIVNKTNSDAVKDANISILVTRPDSSKFDKHPKLISSEGGIYKFEKVLIDKPGRWQIMAKIIVDDLTSFNKFEVNATN